ncbi:MAG: 5-(carboxyamino)imidazole ribonucleotide synthase [Gemmataceae bacterium]|nr:5-(carboxyamino)imidazole ribonucleotide synthase [Gemmataceae bacterium]
MGIIGGGQLGRMLALSGYPLGLQFRILDGAEEAPAGHVSPLVLGPLDHAETLERFAEGLDCATFEFENVPLPAIEQLSKHVPVYPGLKALEKSQDRVVEKEFFQSLLISTAPFASVQSLEDLQQAARTIGLPAILKTRRFGYDGKGQMRLNSALEVANGWETLGSQPLILEGLVPFDRELSQVSVRSTKGEIRHYPLVENFHRNGILHKTIAPAPGIGPNHPLEKQSRQAMEKVMEALDYVGVLAIEWFQMGESLVANEMAPRVHNTGHWTMDGAKTSQFENHVRAVLGWPLGLTDACHFTVMLNLIGSHRPAEDWLANPGVRLHLYGKSPRNGRKLGHVNVLGNTALEALTRSDSLLDWLSE